MFASRASRFDACGCLLYRDHVDGSYGGHGRSERAGSINEKKRRAPDGEKGMCFLWAFLSYLLDLLLVYAIPVSPIRWRKPVEDYAGAEAFGERRDREEGTQCHSHSLAM